MENLSLNYPCPHPPGPSYLMHCFTITIWYYREDENIALNECIQLAYHKACRHHLILVYAREILILDLEINQTVGTIPMERTGSPFLEVQST